MMRKQSEVDKDMRKEKIKECVKDLKTIQRNLKKIYTLVYRNCVQTVIKVNEEFEEKLKVFDHCEDARISSILTSVTQRIFYYILC